MRRYWYGILLSVALCISSGALSLCIRYFYLHRYLSNERRHYHGISPFVDIGAVGSLSIRVGVVDLCVLAMTTVYAKSLGTVSICVGIYEKSQILLRYLHRIL